MPPTTDGPGGPGGKKEVLLLVSVDGVKALLLVQFFSMVAPTWDLPAVADAEAAIRYIIAARTSSTALPGAMLVDAKPLRSHVSDLVQWIDEQPDLAKMKVLVVSDAEKQHLRLSLRSGRTVWVLPRPVPATLVVRALFFDEGSPDANLGH